MNEWRIDAYNRKLLWNWLLTGKKSSPIQFAQQVLCYDKCYLKKENLNVFTLFLKMATTCYMDYCCPKTGSITWCARSQSTHSWGIWFIHSSVQKGALEGKSTKPAAWLSKFFTFIHFSIQRHQCSLATSYIVFSLICILLSIG